MLNDETVDRSLARRCKSKNCRFWEQRDTGRVSVRLFFFLNQGQQKSWILLEKSGVWFVYAVEKLCLEWDTAHVCAMTNGSRGIVTLRVVGPSAINSGNRR